MGLPMGVVRNSNEIRQGVMQGDLTTMCFIYDTDAIEGGTKNNG